MSGRIMEVLRSFLTALIVVICHNLTAQLEKTEITFDSLTIYFDVGKFSTNDTKELISKIKMIPTSGNYRIELHGYTDSAGSVQSNVILASKRMNFIKEIIRQQSPKIVIDTVNVNETISHDISESQLFRRVDMKIISENYKIEFNKPIVLGINFQPGNTDMMPGSKKILEALRDIMLADAEIEIELSGHTCCLHDPYMSKLRAEKIKLYLVNNGLSSQKITCFGYGNKKPKVPEVDAKTEAINRRVEVVFKKAASESAPASQPAKVK